MDETETADHTWAGILNGVMITLLGCAFPTLVIWQAARQWQTLVSTWRPEVDSGTLVSVGLLLGSLQAIHTGVGIVRKNVAVLRKR